ncbi:hypothetical protein GYMLUDRAFT_246686 [Collybiopsis luxurians FD-317 M1]|uniref:RING-type domain-containing protein n=1 Tax=Collybiopsis luxurians FD-317 M1 TaxID=944289 RepID=A0A0D0BR43_9AGAR|nr:hypothetical protein GYMLUDRAFT_246686 [Collybiopsis luxurians FD-317 M1]
MSAEPSNSSEFDYWEFVSCSKCHLSFASGAGATVPFWLTECGHVVCNNHLNSDQSCAHCGARGILLVPLQNDMEPPMSEWFRPIPCILDSAAFAVKFQQESMAAQIRHLQMKQQQHRAYIEKLRRENAQLKEANEMLTVQLTGRQSHGPHGHEPAAYLNTNGKRQMIDFSNPPTSSSPQVVAMPVGPTRITLPPGQNPPHLSSNRDFFPTENLPAQAQHSERPGSSRFTQRFSYSPAQEAQMRLPQLSHAQSAHTQLRRPLPQNRQSHNTSQSQMPPPPIPAKFTPSPNPKTFYSSIEPPGSSRDATGNRSSSQRLANPQPNTNRLLPLNERFPPPPGTFAGNTSNFSSNSQRFAPPHTNSARGNFRPATSSHLNGTPNPKSNVLLTRAQSNSTNGGGSAQRVPFIPGK